MSNFVTKVVVEISKNGIFSSVNLLLLSDFLEDVRIEDKLIKLCFNTVKINNNI